MKSLRQIRDAGKCYILDAELILLMFKRYIPLSYIKRMINENEFSLNNFDWDIKDSNRLVNEIKELSILAEFLKK